MVYQQLGLKEHKIRMAMAEAGSGPVIRIEEEEKTKESSDDGGEPARGILKKRGRVITPEER